MTTTTLFVDHRQTTQLTVEKSYQGRPQRVSHDDAFSRYAHAWTPRRAQPLRRLLSSLTPIRASTI